MIGLVGTLLVLGGIVMGTLLFITAVLDGQFKDAPPPDPATRVILTGEDRVER